MKNKILESVQFLQEKGKMNPSIGIILGTGLGSLVGEIEVIYKFPYEDIPHFPVSTVESHKGQLIYGVLGGKSVLVMQGRFHYYEGYSTAEVGYPVRVMKELGVENLLISNACGALNPAIKKGDLMVLKDHINLLPDNPLRGANDETLGPRFPDMSQPYYQPWIKIIEELAAKESVRLTQGVYVAVTGPNLETSAEYRYLRMIGGDVVGMSTVPEVIVAVHAGLKVLAISVVTDEGYLEPLPPVQIPEILAVAAEAEPKLTKLFKDFIANV